MSSKKVAEIVVQTLEAAGVRHCYGIVGDTLNHVTDAIHRSGIAWVHTRHEEAAAFAAGAGAAGVRISTLVPLVRRSWPSITTRSPISRPFPIAAT